MNPTKKQKLWRLRNHFLWRVKGIGPFLVNADIATDREREILSEIRNLSKELIDNSVESSRELGFNAHYRCEICGRIIKDGQNRCTDHFWV